jgi:hypothetical protein
MACHPPDVRGVVGRVGRVGRMTTLDMEDIIRESIQPVYNGCPVNHM